VGVDIGGTFTDLVACDADTGELRESKSLTTPADLVDGVMACLRRGDIDPAAVRALVHGTTVAINTVIERSGARAALVVTRGTRDVYFIGRGNRPDAYDVFFQRPEPLVPRRLTFEVNERLLASGEVLRPLDRGEVDALAAVLDGLGVEAVGVCFLHSYANPAHEAAAVEALAARLPGRFVTPSHQILRKYGEYERVSTTAVNAYIGPRVDRYLRDLDQRLRREGFAGELLIMQSGGGTMAPDTARRTPVALMESGPVGGIVGSAEVAARLGHGSTIAFDMGGTTAKAALIRDGEPAMVDGYYIGGYASGHPVVWPVVDVVEVGAGGGSIAWLDEVGALKVGPRSAGADPGPICYGRGGTEPTITDANVVLGRIGAPTFLGGEMPLDAAGAAEGLGRLAEPLGLTVPQVALGILRLATARMSLAVRETSVARGHDPRDFALVASGGAGPLHAVAIARDLHIPTVVIPRLPAHFSALGIVTADRRHDRVQTYLHPLEEVDFGELRAMFAQLEEEVGAALRRGGGSGEVEVRRAVDMRYAGQEFTLPVPVTPGALASGDPQSLRSAFDELHQRHYGHAAADEPVEVVGLRVTGLGRQNRPRWREIPPGGAASPVRERRRVHLDDPAEPLLCPVYRRDDLGAGAEVRGPALIEEYASTTVLFPGDRAAVAPTGEIVVTVAGAAQVADAKVPAEATPRGWWRSPADPHCQG
jgi:N-methylhydantoinase A